MPPRAAVRCSSDCLVNMAPALLTDSCQCTRSESCQKAHINPISLADGVVELDGSRFLELEDVAHGYRRPCIMDVKLGRQTWYPGADPAYAERCAARDAATMQAAVGFRICGLQVHHAKLDSLNFRLLAHLWLPMVVTRTPA